MGRRRRRRCRCRPPHRPGWTRCRGPAWAAAAAAGRLHAITPEFNTCTIITKIQITTTEIKNKNKKRLQLCTKWKYPEMYKPQIPSKLQERRIFFSLRSQRSKNQHKHFSLSSLRSYCCDTSLLSLSKIRDFRGQFTTDLLPQRSEFDGIGESTVCVTRDFGNSQSNPKEKKKKIIFFFPFFVFFSPFFNKLKMGFNILFFFSLTG